MRNKINYAVVGLGHIAQVAVLPAFRTATNSKLVALISEDEKKLSELGSKYGVKSLYHLSAIDECLESSEVDVLYIATPNDTHADLMARAASYKVHVLCEKPLAINSAECWSMIRSAEENDIRLMTAYRLHFQEANLKVIDLIEKGEIGDVQSFTSTFTMQIQDPDNIRLRSSDDGGGPLFDIGIYCINAVRSIFKDEPEEVFAMNGRVDDKRFLKTDSHYSILMRFGGGRHALFNCSFAAADSAVYTVIGTQGSITLENAYEYAGPMTLTLKKNGKTTTHKFSKHDQFAAEISYFSNCLIRGNKPEPCGHEGLDDVMVIEAILESVKTNRSVRVYAPQKEDRPRLDQKINRPSHGMPRLVNVRAPTK